MILRQFRLLNIFTTMLMITRFSTGLLTAISSMIATNALSAMCQVPSA